MTVDPTTEPTSGERDAGTGAAERGAETAERGEPLLSVRDLRTYYDERSIFSRSPPVKAVDGVSFDVFEGETIGLVGESGCGKTTLGRTLLGLEEPTGGTISAEGRDVTDLSGGDAREWQQRVGMVFQDPQESLNDRQTVGQIVREPLEAHDWPTLSVAVTGADEASVTGNGPVEDRTAGGSVADPESADITVALDHGDPAVTVRQRLPLDPSDVTVSVDRGGRPTVSVTVEKSVAELRRDRAEALITRVGLNEEHVRRYPHQFSGGQRQRVGIARALALEPDFLVLDEPVSALDVSVQARIINLLERLQAEFGLTYLFIAHDLSVVRHIADRVAVMYLGNVVELGPTESVFSEPAHPYTISLLSAIPGSGSPWDGERVTLRGTPPSPRDPPDGCSFATRCPAKIRSDEFDLPEATWRALDELRVVFRARARGDDSALDRARGALGLDVDADAVDEAADELLGDRSLPADAQRAVDEAVDLAKRGEDGGAAAKLREAFGSRCDRETPEAVSTGEVESRCFRCEDGYRGARETVAAREHGDDR